MTLGLRARRVVIGLVLVAACAAFAYYVRVSAPSPVPSRFLPDELIEDEDREILRDFRTSFVPRDARYADVADYLELHELYKNGASKKVKRNSHGAGITNDGTSKKISASLDKVNEYGQDEVNISEVPRSSVDDHKSSSPYDYDEYYEDAGVWEVRKVEDGTKYENNFGPHPSMGENGGVLAGRGPLDVEVDLRSMPELEEAEIALDPTGNSKTNTFDSEPTGTRALWSDQGDAQKIRNTQADIMGQYMDWTADPCDDFYQYACGNWAQVNPIPPDKAGFDTFEMLRENLDTVLREILELNTNDFCNEYPGPNLDLGNDIILNPISTTEYPTEHHISSSDSAVNLDLGNLVSQVLSPPKDLKDIHETTFVPNSINDTDNYNINERVNYLKEVEKSAMDINIPNSERKNTIEERHVPENNDSARLYKRNAALNKNDEIEEEAKRKVEEGTANVDAAMKVRFLFRSCMNHDILSRRGHQPLLDLLETFGGWPILNSNWDASKFDWLEIMAKLRLYNNDILISEWVGPDIMNSDEFVIQLDQTSLGLPTRDYFLQNSNKAYVDGYKNYIVKIAILLGSSPDNVEQRANEIILFETRLAEIVSSPEERRNVSLLYQRLSVLELTDLVPQIDWQRYLSIVLNRQTEMNETVVVFALKYVQNLVKLIAETDSKVVANYLLWRFIRHRVNNLDDRFQEAKQQFYYVLFGREQAPLRWKNCVSQVNSNMGMGMGSMFVQKYFDENSKNDTLTMTKEIQESFMEMLNLTTWIDNDTKSLAIEKVETMMLRIGYPDFILNKTELNERYKELRIHPNKYFENTLNILQHLNKIEQSRLGQPVNKTVWNTAPAIVNAYYSRNKNQIMFPAGILQPPFYHRHFPKSLNYGGIGVVIGHEITHGFDDKGRLFDNNGNLHKWWKSLAIEEFHKKAQCLIDQYSNYTVSEVSMEIDGFNTQGENIADNGGIKQAFTAYHRWLAENRNNDETLPGLNLTSSQLFFLNFAQVWCGAMRPEALKNKLKTAVHSPGKFRVIGTLSNFDKFAEEFNCPTGSRMNPVTKCRVW